MGTDDDNDNRDALPMRGPDLVGMSITLGPVQGFTLELQHSRSARFCISAVLVLAFSGRLPLRDTSCWPKC